MLTIARAESFNHHSIYTSDLAHDLDYETFYSPKDNAIAGNFLKLYLSQDYSIGEVKFISRPNNNFVNRMQNTELKLYSSGESEIEIASCGKITGTYELW